MHIHNFRTYVMGLFKRYTMTVEFNFRIKFQVQRSKIAFG